MLDVNSHGLFMEVNRNRGISLLPDPPLFGIRGDLMRNIVYLDHQGTVLS